MLPPLASSDELETWMGVAVSNPDRAEAILAAASTLVRVETGRTWVDEDGATEDDVTTLQMEQVKTVVILVAERVWSNPRGITQQSTGPFSASVAEWAAYGLALTDSEKAMLPTTSGSTRPKLWTLNTTRCPTGDLPDIYLEVEGSELIPHVPEGSVNW